MTARPEAPETRLATKADLPAVSAALARAFDDDPFTSYLFPADLPGRADRLARFMGVGAAGALEHGSLYTTPGLEGAAAWLPPNEWKIPLRRQLALAPTMIRTLGRRTVLAMRALMVLESGHPEEPHWYLEILGTEPAAQGRGIGGALMAPVLARCDTEGLPAYLESSKEANVAYYERAGFRVTEEVRLPQAGPTLWRMWRDPQG